MEDRNEAQDAESVDRVHALLLGACTTVLAVAFLLLLIGDQVSAAGF